MRTILNGDAELCFSPPYNPGSICKCALLLAFTRKQIWETRIHGEIRQDLGHTRAETRAVRQQFRKHLFVRDLGACKQKPIQTTVHL